MSTSTPCALAAAVVAFVSLAPRVAIAEPREVELSRLWSDRQPPSGALLWPPGAGRTGAELRGWDDGRFRLRPGLDASGGSYNEYPRLLPEGTAAFEVHLSERFGGGPMMGSNVDGPALLTKYPASLPNELVGGKRTYASLARAAVAGPLGDHVTYFVEAYDDRGASRPLGAYVDEVTTAPRYTLNVTWQPTPRTRITLGGRYDAIFTDSYGLSSWYYASAARRRTTEEATAVISVRHQIDARNELSARYELISDRDDAGAAAGLLVPAHYNLSTYKTWGNYPFTQRSRKLEHRADVHWSSFHDGVLAKADAHTFTIGLQVQRITAEDDQSRNGGFSFSDSVPRSANGNAAIPFDPASRASWALFSSDRGDDLHAKTAQTTLAAYASDRIQLGSLLTITPGVRFEHFSGGFTGGATAWETNTLAPRLAIVLEPDGWTQLWGSAGRFYQRLDPSMYARARQGAAYSALEYWDYAGDPAAAPDPGIDDPRWSRSRQFPAVIGTLGDVKHPYADRLLVGAMRAFDGLGLRASTRYEYRRYGDMLALWDAGGQYDPRTYSIGPGSRDTVSFSDLRTGSTPTYVIGNPPEARREYHSVNVSLAQSVTRWLLLRASGTWSLDRGNLDALSGLSTEWRDPSGRINSYGNMPGFDTWSTRLGITLDVLGARAWIDYSFYSGQYYSRVLRVAPTNAPRTYVYDEAGRGGYQYPSRHLVDLRVARRVARIGGGDLGVWINVYNLLNSATPTGFREPATIFRSVRSLETPREVYVGVHYDYD